MKTLSIKLRQDPDSDLFSVVSFENTMDLSIGDMIPREKLREWLGRAYVKITVIGLVQKEETLDEAQPLDTPHANRADLSTLISHHDTQPF